MRRGDREVTGLENLLAIMKQCDVCRLALNGNGYPYILPLNFGMEVRNGQVVLYFHGAAEGTKYELMARDSRASFEMDCGHVLFTEPEKPSCSMAYQSVIGTSELSLVPPEEKLHALQVLMAHYHEDDFPISLKTMERTVVFRLTVRTMTGKQRRRH